MKIEEFLTKKNMICLMLCIGLLQIAGYYFAGTMAKADGGIAVAQPDTLLYCQAARRIVEGHPFSFSAGEAVCTGTTSVLYPYILAVPYALGATGDSLLTAGFVLNALFYLVFLFGWGLAIWAWLEKPWARAVAAALVAFSGHAAYCTMAQSDIGLWLAVSGLLVAGLANGWVALYAPLLILGPWVRPEGMVCVIAFALVVCGGGILHLWPWRRRDLVVALLAIASMGGVFALNYALTGEAQFSSVVSKGYFKNLPFAAAFHQTAADLIRLGRSYGFGFATDFPRFFFCPIVGAILLWGGIFAADWRGPGLGRKLVLVLAVGGGFLTVAQSGWQNTNMDRYLVWMTPFFLLLMAQGAVWAAERLPNLKFLPGSVLVGFSAVMAVTMICIFNRLSCDTDLLRQFAAEADAALPKGASVSAWGACGVAYQFAPNRRLAHLSAIYSPEFDLTSVPGTLEILKHEPGTRFAYWFRCPAEGDADIGNAKTIFGEGAFLAGPNGMEIDKADWSALDAALRTDVPDGKELVARVDVGYRKDEHAARYDTYNRYPGQETFAFVHEGKLGNRTIIESGRAILGGDSMTVPLHPGQDAMVVLRTLDRVELPVQSGLSIKKQVFSFKSPFELRIVVDGKEVRHTRCECNTNGFTDVQIMIPGSAIRQTPSRVEFFGDHVACGYWFYQKK